MANYVVVLAAEADARFRDESLPLRVRAVPTRVGPVDLVFRTRYADEGFSTAVPRELWIDARGAATAEASLTEVISAYANAAAGFLPMIALSANAWVGDLEPKLAYDATPGSSERDYFQSFVPEVRGTLPPTRRVVNPQVTVAMLSAIWEHQDRDRLVRAGAQYALALAHWYPGREIMTLAHLYIGMEALTPVVLKRELERQPLTAEELAASWGVENAKLGAEVRRRVLFRGDTETAKKARDARNGFTHSFLDFTKVRELAQDVTDATARYLREAIFELSGVAEATRVVLTSHPFDRPLRSHYHRYVWATLVGEGEDLSADGQEYPTLIWKSGLKSLAVDPSDEDRLLAQPEETMTARTAPGIAIQPRRWEMWGAEASDAEPVEGSAEQVVTRAAEEDKFEVLLAAVGELAMRVGSGEAVELHRHDLEAVALFDRCRSTFAAVRVLLRHQLAHEAVMLGRPLFTESLTLAELAASDDTRRVEVVVGWALHNLADIDGMYREAASRGDDVSEELSAITDRRAQLEEYARRHGARPRHWSPNEKNLAGAHGRQAEYMDFRLAHHFVHGSTMATQQRYARIADDTVAVGGPHAEFDIWAKPAGLFASYSLLYAVRALCSALHWPEPSELTSLLSRADELQASLQP